MRKLFVAVLAIGFFHCCVAQQNPPSVTGEFRDFTIDQFVDALSAKTGYRFFYDVRSLDSVRINVTANNEPVSKVLERAFRNSDISFSIDQHNNVFVIKGRAIQTDLPQGF